ncbi:MAG: nucleotidyltransferase family protein [Phycisphaerales bacterium JB063]
MVKRVDYNPTQLAEFCTRYGIARLSLFGSVLRDDFRPESDIDVLVEFQPETRVGYFELVAIESALADLLQTGRKVDLRTPGELSRYFREDVLKQAEVMYGDA